jgi:ubiquinone/menaquinone biosynthesis C-methylase UbiE
MEKLMSQRTLGFTARQSSQSGPELGASKTTETKYVLGHSESEIRRLISQAAIVRPITERLLRTAGVGRGMRVLDLGCGAGDVSMLAAALVGPSGSVIGIDRSPQVVAVAREQARKAALEQVHFQDVALEAFSDRDLFDCVIGRYVVIHQADPVDFLRTAARFLRPGGIIAFHEVSLHRGVDSLPRVPRWQIAAELVLAALREAIPHYDAGGRLIEHFHNAGLPPPNLFCEVPIGGGEDSPLYGWCTDALRSVLPQLTQMGIATLEATAIETLESRLRTAVVDAHSQIEFPPQVCAWTKT